MHQEKPKIGNIFQKSVLLLLICIFAIFSLIVVKLFFLQILEGEKYRQKSEGNRLKVFEIPPVRGPILDRNGYILASSDVSFSLYIIPSECKPVMATTKAIASIFGVESDYILNKVKKGKAANPYSPVLIKKGLNIDQITVLLSHSFELPGIHIEETSKRAYPLGDFMSHVLGYVGEVSKKQLEELSSLGYKMGDMVGKMGVERLKETTLRGTKGGSLIETDALGRMVREVTKVPPVNGETVSLTLDYRLQEIVEAELEGIRGAIACLDPKNGDVLAMASAPSFDPNLFVDGISGEVWNSLLSDPNKPLVNRVVSGLYPMGSVFKVVVAIAALEEGVTDEKEMVNCTGSYRFGNREFGCWKEHGHGPVNLRRALVESCDYYFYEMGRRLGVDKISLYANLLGLGSLTGTGLLEEKEGIVPSTEWKRKTLKTPWYPGETISYAIGQGYLAITPLQVARMFSAVSNGGLLPKVRITMAQEEENPKEVKLPIKTETLRVIRDALWGVVNEPRGTGTKSRVEGWDVIGKTGTAQTRSVNIVEKDINRVPYHLRDHAWFVAAAPKEDPQLVVVVLVEHGGHGGSAAAPIAKRIFEWYFRGNTG